VSEAEDLIDLARRLAALPPAARPPDRDRLLIQMGRSSTRSRLWPSVAAAFALLSAGLGLRLATQEPAVVERVTTVPVPGAETALPPPDAAPAPNLDEYQRWHQKLARIDEPLPAALPQCGTYSTPIDLPPELRDSLPPHWRSVLSPRRNPS
jgi:hypothetical protein